MAVQRLRVGTLNLWGKQGPWELRREVAVRALEALSLDVLGLQEIIRFDATAVGADPVTSSDQSRELADALGFHACFGAALDLGFGYTFGNAIVSRFPLGAVECTPLPGAPGVEPRSVVSALVETPFGAVPFFSTHLSWKFDEGAIRLRQVLALTAEVDRRQPSAPYPAILVGDFNAEPDADELRFLRGLHVRDGLSTYFIDAFGEVGRGDGATFNRKNAFAAAVREPDRRIDYVLVRGRDPRGWGRPLACAVAFDQSYGQPPIFASDHFGVVADLAIPNVDSRAISESKS
jgi:endonuclease/exonuclease/phosphatase family metal-dependent hydrolase